MNLESEYRPKLPSLEVLIFYGDKSKFTSFIDKFNSVIGTKINIINVDKLSYLLKYVKGPALKLIEALPITDSNYETVLKILNHNYLNVDEINNELSLKLINLRVCKENYDDVFNFYCELEWLLSQIANNKLDIKGSAWLIRPLIFEKLPRYKGIVSAQNQQSLS